jgi:hypothetical protein
VAERPQTPFYLPAKSSSIGYKELSKRGIYFTNGRAVMKLLDAKVNWFENWANHPQFQILVDGTPKLEDYRFQKHGNLYYAELDGSVSIFWWNGKPGEGYAGGSFDIIMADGEPVTLKGPFSSNSMVFNALSARGAEGIKPMMTVEVTDDPAVLERGFTFHSGHITAELGKQAAEMAGVHLVKILLDNGEEMNEQQILSNEPEEGSVLYVPSLEKDRAVKWRRASKDMRGKKVLVRTHYDDVVQEGQ